MTTSAERGNSFARSASQADGPRFRLRCRYRETGRLALLSHLEVAATLERVVRRAGLPFAISNGFSPHMKIAFGAALPVGVGSTCEIFDIQLVRYVPCEKALEALRRATVSDLMIETCAYVESRAKAASVAYPFSTYEARLSQPGCTLRAPVDVTVVRKRREKTLHVDDFLVRGFEPGRFSSAGMLPLAAAVAAPTDAAADDACTFTFTLEAKPTGSLRPDVLMRACEVSAPEGTDAGDVRVVSITRVAQSAQEPEIPAVR